MRRANVLKLLCVAGAITFGQAAAMCVPDEIKEYSPSALCAKIPDIPACKLVSFPGIGEIWTLRSRDGVPMERAALVETYVTLEDGETLRIPDRDGVRFTIESFSDDCHLARGSLEILSSIPLFPSTYYENVTVRRSKLKDYVE